MGKIKLKKPFDKQVMFFCNLTEFWDSRHIQIAKYIAIDEESESEVKICRF